MRLQSEEVTPTKDSKKKGTFLMTASLVDILYLREKLSIKKKVDSESTKANIFIFKKLN